MTQTTVSKILLEVDGEVIYINPNSAEGKALQRLENLDSDLPSQLITLVEEGEEIDVQAGWERLKKRGYKIQIPTTDSSIS
ncbi:MAG: hypothetical protein VKJ02_03100 [Snowella sp.]|nr:hypothetical protein [Snowella sp.]